MPPRTRSTQGSGSSKKLKQRTLLSHFSSPSASSEKQSAKFKPRKAVRSSQKPMQDSESDVESPTRSQFKYKRRASPGPEEGSDSSDVGKIQFEARSSPPQNSVTRESTSEVEAEAISPSRSTKRQRILNSDSDKSEDESTKPRVRTSRRLVKKDADETERQSESDAPKTQKSRLVKGKRPIQSEDDDDILSGIDEEKIIDTRLRGPKPSQRSKFMKNLERLKKKKRGVTLSESEEGISSNDEGLIPGARPSTSGIQRDESDSEDSGQNQDSDGEEELDDFIIEDEGEAQVATLPAMFSMNTHQDLVHHFKVVCQYLVYLAVTTRTARTRVAERLASDEYFSMPLSITRRKLNDIRDSITSSVWRPAYKKALLTYPEFALHNLDFTIPQCDACHLGGRLSTVVGRLGGEPYDRTTFEPKAIESDRPSDDSDDERERTAPEFNLGRFCARRTSVFHELCHWEYELFQALSREVEELSNSGRGFVRIAYVGGVEPPEDVSDADQVMEWLDQRGIINAEWLKVKQLMSRATNLEADVKRGQKDD